MATMLEWDKTGERKFEAGVSKVVLYPMADGSYGAGVAWNGVTKVSENPDGGDANDMWADNIKYASIRSAENIKLGIEAYTYPDEFMACDGSATVSAAKGLSIKQQKRMPFGLCWRTNQGSDTVDLTGGEAYKLHLAYGCTASPSEKSYETINDNPDAITFNWDIDTLPVDVPNFKPTAVLEIDSTKADKSKLQALEAILYGKTTAAKLPLPAEVITTLGGTAVVPGT